MSNEWERIFLGSGVVVNEEGRVEGAIYVNGHMLVESYETGSVQSAIDWAMGKTGSNNSPLYVEKYLQYLLKVPNLKLVHIIAQNNICYVETEYGYVVE